MGTNNAKGRHRLKLAAVIMLTAILLLSLAGCSGGKKEDAKSDAEAALTKKACRS